jgi:hypothetical protein
MSRYRKIEVRTWSGEKFRAPSALPPSGQGPTLGVLVALATSLALDSALALHLEGRENEGGKHGPK